MAPEQLAGAEVTARSDIYALGLVLYELFTGQRALDGKNLAELIRRREQSAASPRRPRSCAISIRRSSARSCAASRPIPRQRPGSALAVAAALPGGDPLAAALAAGETPSPEMVAAAGGADVVSARSAVARRRVDRVFAARDPVLLRARHDHQPRAPRRRPRRRCRTAPSRRSRSSATAPILGHQQPGAWSSRWTTRRSSRAVPPRRIAGRRSGRSAPKRCRSGTAPARGRSCRSGTRTACSAATRP